MWSVLQYFHSVRKLSLCLIIDIKFCSMSWRGRQTRLGPQEPCMEYYMYLRTEYWRGRSKGLSHTGGVIAQIVALESLLG